MFDKILQHNMCAGCGVCQSVFGKDQVQVELNEMGFYRPIVVDSEMKTNFLNLNKFCPALIVEKTIVKTPRYDSIWGEIYSCFIGSSGNNEIRSEASSGGGISSILKYLLETKEVDAVIHIGANDNQPFINEVKISTNVEEVIANANSRYSASAPLINIHEILANEHYEHIVFVGKPCDVAALRQLSQIDPVVKSKVKYYISFFCAGVPSINATKSTVEALGVDISNVKKVDYRKEGWPGYFRVIDKLDNKFKLSYSLTWMKLLSPAVQFRCKVCPDGVGHFADIVCADGWDNFDNKGFPTFKNAPGKSLVISRTVEGENIINRAIVSGDLLKIKDIENIRFIDQMQPGQMSKKRYHMARKFATYLKTGSYLRSNKEFYYKATFTASFLSQVKNFWGTFKRI